MPEVKKYRVKRKIEDLVGELENIRLNNLSVVIRLRRQPFDDPLLTVYFVKGRPIMANSFVVHEPWYSGILSNEDVENSQGNLIAYAYRKLGDTLFEHLERYSMGVIDRVVDEVNRNGWDFSIHIDNLREDAIKKLFGAGTGLTLRVKEDSDTVSLLPEINSMGITLISFLDSMEKIGRGFDILNGVHHETIKFGITGHYVLFFPYVVIMYGSIKGRDFLGEAEYGPNLSRLFPLLRKEVNVLPRFLEEYPWEVTGRVSVGRPFALYVRYKGRGVLTYFRSTSEGLYPCRMEVSSPNRVMEGTSRIRDRLSKIVEEVMNKIEDRPKSLLRVEISRYIKTYPHPDDLYNHLKLNFNL